MTDGDIAFAALDRAAAERFQSLRTPLGVSSFGINLMVLQPGQRGRIHAHERQEEVYLVLEGELTLLVEGVEHRLGADQLARVGPAARRQLVLLALGAAGDHAGRDALAWPAWEDGGPGAPPQEVPLPPDLPLA